MSILLTESFMPDYMIEGFKEIIKTVNSDKHWDNLNSYEKRIACQYEEEYKLRSGYSIDLKGAMYHTEGSKIFFGGKYHIKENLIIIDDGKKMHQILLERKLSMITDKETYETEAMTYDFSVVHKAIEYFPEKDPTCAAKGIYSFLTASVLKGISEASKSNSTNKGVLENSLGFGVDAASYVVDNCQKEYAMKLGIVDSMLKWADI